MSEQLLTILKLCLLLLMYLFFFRVVRAVWVEINGPVVTASPTARRSARRERRTARTAGRPVLEALEPEGMKGVVYSVDPEMTVGRGAGCRITLDDTFVSQIHARVFTSDEQVLVEDLGSTNGTYVNGRRITSPVVMQRSDRLQIGNTVLELR